MVGSEVLGVSDRLSEGVGDRVHRCNSEFKELTYGMKEFQTKESP